MTELRAMWERRKSVQRRISVGPVTSYGAAATGLTIGYNVALHHEAEAPIIVWVDNNPLAQVKPGTSIWG